MDILTNGLSSPFQPTLQVVRFFVFLSYHMSGGKRQIWWLELGYMFLHIIMSCMGQKMVACEAQNHTDEFDWYVHMISYGYTYMGRKTTSTLMFTLIINVNN